MSQRVYQRQNLAGDLDEAARERLESMRLDKGRPNVHRPRLEVALKLAMLKYWQLSIK